MRRHTARNQASGSGYERGCSCAACREVHRLRMADQRQRRRARRVWIDGRMVAVDATTHNESTYKNWCCRCETCSDVHAEACRRNRERRRRRAEDAA